MENDLEGKEPWRYQKTGRKDLVGMNLAENTSREQTEDWKIRKGKIQIGMIVVNKPKYMEHVSNLEI